MSRVIVRVTCSYILVNDVTANGADLKTPLYFRDGVLARDCQFGTGKLRERRERIATRDRNANRIFKPSSRYSRPPRSIYRLHLGHISASSPLYALSFIFRAFHNPRLVVLLARERTVFNTRPIGQYRGATTVTAGWTPFLLSTPFGHVRPGYIYRILTSESSVHPVGVKGLASWRRTVVQSAQRKDPSFFWIERPER